jgi:hypothetical protein
MAKPSRSQTKKKNGGPQGNAAWVVIRKLKYGERDLDQEFFALAVRGDELTNEINSPDVSSDRKNEIGDEIQEIELEILGLLLPFIVDWNWVDDDGNKMPIPETVGTVELYREEANWLTDAIREVVFPRREEKN